MPLAVFPKYCLEEMCPVEDGKLVYLTPSNRHTVRMPIEEFLQVASNIPGVEGVELYSAFLPAWDPNELKQLRIRAEKLGLEIPNICHSAELVHPDALRRKAEVALQRYYMRAAKILGAKYFRTQPGSKHPKVTVEGGIRHYREACEELAPLAKELEIELVAETHYLDPKYTAPDFSWDHEIFLPTFEAVKDLGVKVQLDPSNPFIRNKSPVDVLKDVIGSVATVHCSDRSLPEGMDRETFFRGIKPDTDRSYLERVRHGVIGSGSIPYDEIFELLEEAGFAGWFCIENGRDKKLGPQHLEESAQFLLAKMNKHGFT